MCGPIAMLVGAAVGLLGGSMMSEPEAPPPPTPALPPAIAPPTSQFKEADVRIGSDEAALVDEPDLDAERFERRRVSTNTFGNLGKSALTL